MKQRPNRSERGKRAGCFGLGMLALAWIGLSSIWGFLPRSSDSMRLLIVLILAGPGAGGMGIIAGWWNDKAWYWLAIAGFATAAMIVAAVAV